MTSSAFDPARLNRFEPLVLLFGLFEHVFLSLSCVWSSAGELGGLDRLLSVGRGGRIAPALFEPTNCAREANFGRV